MGLLYLIIAILSMCILLICNRIKICVKLITIDFSSLYVLLLLRSLSLTAVHPFTFKHKVAEFNKNKLLSTTIKKKQITKNTMRWHSGDEEEKPQRKKNDCYSLRGCSMCLMLELSHWNDDRIILLWKNVTIQPPNDRSVSARRFSYHEKTKCPWKIADQYRIK